MTRDPHWNPAAIMDRMDARTAAGVIDDRMRAKMAEERAAKAEARRDDVSMHLALIAWQDGCAEFDAEAAEKRAAKAEAEREQAQTALRTVDAAYGTMLDRWKESQSMLATAKAVNNALAEELNAAQEALRAAVAGMERMRASHTPRKRMAAQERPDGLYEYRPVDPWEAA